VASSAVIIEVPEAEPVIGRWRERFDPIAQVGIPPHVTVLFPFHAPARLDASRLAVVAAIAANSLSFDFELVEVNEFPGVLWLRPVPAGQFIALTRRLVLAFPECPPYDGKYEEQRPHVTVVHADGLHGRDFAQVRAEIERDIDPQLPIRARATSLSVFGSDDDRRWRRVASFPLAPLPADD
jgi:2'-5' RNA ligase